MSTQWLAFQSVHHGQKLLSAINTLSIHTKLGMSGVADDARAEAAEHARETVRSFLKRLEALVRESGEDGREPVLGTDPGLRQLTRSFIAAKRDPGRFRSVLFRAAPAEMERLLGSSQQQDQQSLVECLDELRRLVEEHVHGHAAQILGEF